MSGMGEKSTDSNLSANLLAIVMLGVLGVLIVPLPGVLIDGFLALNLSLAVLTLLVALRVVRPLDFSVFPAFLLITTLFRLGLNVATTRVILLHGGSGGAGKIIKAFGEFAVGGSIIVGAVVFLILLVVNFMVITKGSGRVSEVAARFTLDALPGKQMSIDADLAAGAITDDQARSRRSELSQEAEFFGAMDGASKFVRGDAIAGLIITAINLLGGFLAGTLRDGTSFVDALSTYTILTVGDGLLSQLPALFISTAAGIVITKAGSKKDLGAELSAQIFGNAHVLIGVSSVLIVLALVPGMPSIALLVVSGGGLFLARRAQQMDKKAVVTSKKEKAKSEPQQSRIEDLLVLDSVELQVGLSLVPLIDGARADLPNRVTALRKQVAADLGIVLPAVHLKDNLGLAGNSYRVMIRGVEIASGVAHADMHMALDPSGKEPAVSGISAIEPTFGLPVRWVRPEVRAEAERKGYTLVDPGSVITTHLSEVLRKNAHELVGRQETQELVSVLGKSAPKLVEEVVPQVVTLGELSSVVRELLREQVSVRDFRTVLEAVADAALRSKDVSSLVEAARVRLRRTITQQVAIDGVVHAVTLEPDFEQALRSTLGQQDGEVVLAPSLELAQVLLQGLETEAARLASDGRPAVLLAPTDLRRPLFVFASRFVPDLRVVSARELTPGTRVERRGSVRRRLAA